jgi:hypothetical protein
MQNPCGAMFFSFLLSVSLLSCKKQSEPEFDGVAIAWLMAGGDIRVAREKKVLFSQPIGVHFEFEAFANKEIKFRPNEIILKLKNGNQKNRYWVHAEAINFRVFVEQDSEVISETLYFSGENHTVIKINKGELTFMVKENGLASFGLIFEHDKTEEGL